MSALDIFRSRRMAVLAALGFSSGLPLMLTGQTLGAWLSDEGLSLKAIGAFSLIALAYNAKPAWAPLFDRWRLPWLGRRRGWIALLQLGLVAAIAALGSVDPRRDAHLLAALAVVVAILSASQDAVIDAYNTDLLAPEERAAGAAVYVVGYRTAMVVSGVVALALADQLAWSTIYGVLAALMGLGLVATLLAEEPAGPPAPARLYQGVADAFRLLARRPGIAALLVFIGLFKIGDHVGLVMTIPFLERGLGYGFGEIAAFYQGLGLIGIFAGGVCAGALVPRLGLRRALLLFGALQAATNLLYASLALAGPSYPLLIAAVVGDQLANAMGSAAFVALIMSLCDARVSATQYALLTSLSSLPGRLLGAAGGHLHASIGWAGFWAFTAAAALPALLLIGRLRIDRSDR